MTVLMTFFKLKFQKMDVQHIFFPLLVEESFHQPYNINCGIHG
jgi:hypothetical protein